jgi:hypothetical protein
MILSCAFMLKYILIDHVLQFCGFAASATVEIE